MNKEDKKIKDDFNGYSFDEKDNRKKMKYIVIMDGDLDINNAYAFKNLLELNNYLKDNKTSKIKAVFKIKDITK